MHSSSALKTVAEIFNLDATVHHACPGARWKLKARARLKRPYKRASEANWRCLN